ncbi:alpha/beta fold hydrolase [Terracidiphilus gabretensis]|uniref:alpha/beta fold hydrolase n=1 Tax=Terracidiphilus gabretensis TaxID=1577687 RepID=UPI0009E83473|nr:alpha/beta hydrolase [Terracidiphilus gabretensis]
MGPYKLLIRVCIAIVLLCLLAGSGGAAYNALSIRHYRQIAGVPGKLYRIDGYSMHLYCTGQATPTIVLSSGLGDDFTGWAKVQPVLSQQTRVCSYDRAGFGWSESRPDVQDANAVSSQLHQLMEAAAVQRPFVLVGHSLSGIYLRSYIAHYPGDVAGLVLVDGSTPLQDDRIPKELVKIQEDQRRQMPWQKLLMTFGWYRLQGICTSVPPGFEAYSAWIKADSCIPSQMDAVENELDAVRASGEETIHAGPFGTLPVLILSHDPNVLPPNWPAAISKANSIVWSQMQEEAKSLSGQSKRIIAKGSDHYIQNDRADLVNREIASFVVMIRSHQSFPDNGSTTEE